MSLLLARRRSLLFPSEAAAASYADEVLADSPVGYWRLEETSGSTAADETGNGNTGTVFGANLATTGQVGSAAAFDGTDDYLDVGKLGTWGSGLGSGWAVEFWFKNVREQDFLCGFLNDGTANVLQIWRNDVDTLAFFWRGTDGNTRYGDVPYTATADWRHLVVSSAGTARTDMAVYLDSSPLTITWVTGDATPAGFADLDYKLLFGARDFRGVPSNFAQTDMDELAVYGSALSAARVTAHYDAGVA